MGEVVYFANYMSVSYLFKKTENGNSFGNFVSTTKSSVPIPYTDRLWYRNAFPVVVASLYLPKARKLGNVTGIICRPVAEGKNRDPF